MRQTPMTYFQQVDLQSRMMRAFNLLPTSNTSIRGPQSRKLSRKAELALNISEEFFALVEPPESYLPDGELRDAMIGTITPPATEAEMLQEIRYAFGWNWLMWLLIRQFVIQIVKWLWKHYHDEDSPGQSSCCGRCSC